MEPDLLMTGERAALGPLRVDLAPAYARWLNDPELRAGIMRRGLQTPEVQAAWVERTAAAAAEPRPRDVVFTIYDAADATPVGVAGLHDLDHLMGRATFGIGLGERRGRGIGTDATRLILRWAFEDLLLHNVLLGAKASNAAAIRAYEKAGFQVIGRRREALRTPDGRCDEILMDAVTSAGARGGGP